MANYWLPKHEAWAAAWISADTKQQYFLYNKLHAVIVKMVEIIANRYFSLSFAEQKQCYEEALNQVFLNLHKFNPEKSKAYSYCGMIIKHHFYNHVTNYGLKTKIEFEYINDYNPIDTGQELYPEKEYIDLERLLKRLQEIKAGVIQSIQEDKDRKLIVGISRKETLIKICDVCIEFAIKFESFKTIPVIDYCYQRFPEFTHQTIANYFYELFGVHISFTEDGFTGRPIRTEDISFFQDDFEPNITSKNIRDRKRIGIRKENRKYLYF